LQGAFGDEAIQKNAAFRMTLIEWIGPFSIFHPKGAAKLKDIHIML